MKFTPEIGQKFKDLDCTCRFVWVSPTYKEHPTTGKPVVDTDPRHRAAGVYCYIVDNATKEAYATGYSPNANENEALDNALANAITAEKPMTPAQKFTRSQVMEAVSIKATENAELRAEIEALKAQLATLAAPKPERKKPGPKPKIKVEPEPTPI